MDEAFARFYERGWRDGLEKAAAAMRLRAEGKGNERRKRMLHGVAAELERMAKEAGR